MIKRFAVCLGLILFMLFVLFTLVSNAQAPDNTFTLTINSNPVTVILPGILPSMETAVFAGEQCFNLAICMQGFCLDISDPRHDHVNFLYTDKGEVIALIWSRTAEAVYISWKYVNGLPALSSIPEIKALITDRVKPPKTA